MRLLVHTVILNVLYVNCTLESFSAQVISTTDLRIAKITASLDVAAVRAPSKTFCVRAIPMNRYSFMKITIDPYFPKDVSL
jgi:hypothetical protein